MEALMIEELKFNCPHCQHLYTDYLEVLDPDVLQAFKCENCQKNFTLLLKECPSCTSETVVKDSSLVGVIRQILTEVPCDVD